MDDLLSTFGAMIGVAVLTVWVTFIVVLSLKVMHKLGIVK